MTIKLRNLHSLLLISFTVLLSCKDTGSKTVNTTITAALEYEIEAALGEGALWNHKTMEFYWVDIEGKKFHIYNPETKENRSFNTPSRPGTVVPKNDSIAVLALEDGIYELNTRQDELSLLVAIEEDMPENRFNDGKCDPMGNLWVGSMRYDQKEPGAHLYKVDEYGDFERMLSGITISNGIVWSKDNGTMYYIDTPTGTIRAFDYDIRTSTISNDRVAVNISPDDGFPDGMAIDENDHLWVGMWNGDAVACYDPDSGKLISKISVPAHNVTACAFGGENLDTLYITTSSLDMTDEERKRYPKAGSIFVVKPGVKGVESPFFGGN